MSSLLGTSNFSFYAIPAAWVLSIVPHFYAVSLFDSAKLGGNEKWNNAKPRQEVATIAHKTKHTPAEAKYLRAESAQSNGFENLAFFAVAVLAGNVARLPVDTLNTFAAVYLASRVVYNLSYIMIADHKLAGMRSIAYLTGIGAIFRIFIKAGNAFY